MPENPTPNGPVADGTAPAATPVNAPVVTPAAPAAPADDVPGADALGDAGKKALDSMKANWHSERDQRKALEQRLADLEAKQTAPDPRADRRIVRSEIKAAAKGVLADPTDALTFLGDQLDNFKVDENGEVDSKAITAALEDLLTRKPHLAASKRPRFEGRADNGSQGQPPAGQMTLAEVRRLSAAGNYDAIAKAKAEGRLDDLRGLNK